METFFNKHLKPSWNKLWTNVQEIRKKMAGKILYKFPKKLLREFKYQVLKKFPYYFWKKKSEETEEKK